MFSRVWTWFTTRWPWYPLKHLLLDEEIIGGPSYAYTLGTSIIMVITLQIVSGIIQLFYYVPTIDHAYDSVSYLRTEVPFGWLIHNLHYWGANIMVVLVALHMVRVYIWGGYKTQLTWLIGIGLLIMTMALTFTGAPLIWDMKGYWAGEVGTSITGTTPVFGGVMKTILRGGESMGQLTLSRFFAIHIGILLPFLLLLVGLHVAAFRTTGVVGAWDREKRKQTGPFWPDQVFKDIVVASVVFFILLTLCVFAPAPFTGPADPSNTSYLPKPEWNFLFLYQSLKYFEGPLEPIGTAGVPTVLIALLALLPFVDRHPERNPALRPIAMICLAVYAGIIITLTVIGYLSPGYAAMPVTPGKAGGGQQDSSETPQKQAERAHPTDSSQKSAAAMPGAKLFSSLGCIACHSINGAGGSVGPELSGDTVRKRDKKWLIEQIRNPKSHNPASIMPAFSSLPEVQVNDLVDYLMTLAGAPAKAAQETPAQPGKPPPASETAGNNSGESAANVSDRLPGRAAYTIGDAENGALLFKKHCAPCHGKEGRGGVPNPGSDDATVPALDPIDRALFNTAPLVFAGNIDRYIQHGSVPDGPNPALKMLPFGDNHSLTQQQIANLEAYVMSLNGTDRAALINPGMQPLHFFYLLVFVFGAAALMLGGIWNKKIRKCD
jgi:ubiquinol-cytochrome c reductase cytochrome b subunit